MKKEVNKKTVLWIVGIFVTLTTAYLLNLRVCAPCTYRYNNPDYAGICDRMCVQTPIWKILFFNLTGINIDYKQKSQILPKPF